MDGRHPTLKQEMIQLIEKLRSGRFSPAEFERFRSLSEPNILEDGRSIFDEEVKQLIMIAQEPQSSHELLIRGVLARENVIYERSMVEHFLQQMKAAPIPSQYTWWLEYFEADDEDVVKVLEAAVDSGSATACSYLAEEIYSAEEKKQLLELGTERGSPHCMVGLACLIKGEKPREALALLSRAAGLRYARAAINAGKLVCKREKARWWRRAHFLGAHPVLRARARIAGLPEKHRVPWGEWFPDPWIQQWVPAQMRLQMKTLVLSRHRRESPVSLLPRDVLLRICFYICTKPLVWKPAKMRLMTILGQAERERRKLGQQLAEIKALLM